jgi:catechol 2,3-dioxygenase-like lactoylglutathione lyase family enzyme
MLDHVSITVSDIAAAERFYDAIMKVLDVVKVGRRPDWLGYGERSRPAYPERVYISIRKGAKPDAASACHWCFKAKWRTQVDAFWDAGIAMTVRPACGITTRHIMRRSSGIPMATGSRRSAITRSSLEEQQGRLPPHDFGFDRSPRHRYPGWIKRPQKLQLEWSMLFRQC